MLHGFLYYKYLLILAGSREFYGNSKIESWRVGLGVVLLLSMHHWLRI